MNRKQIIEARNNGHVPGEILRWIVEEGVEYPAAYWKVTDALGLNKAQADAMQRWYDDTSRGSTRA